MGIELPCVDRIQKQDVNICIHIYYSCFTQKNQSLFGFFLIFLHGFSDAVFLSDDFAIDISGRLKIRIFKKYALVNQGLSMADSISM